MSIKIRRKKTREIRPLEKTRIATGKEESHMRVIKWTWKLSIIKERRGIELDKGYGTYKENKDTGDVRYWQNDKTKDMTKDEEKR